MRGAVLPGLSRGEEAAVAGIYARLFLSFFFKDSLKYVPGRKIFKNGSGSWRQSPAPRYKVMTPASVASSPLRRSADVE
jgi:hypothetical protein